MFLSPSVTHLGLCRYKTPFNPKIEHNANQNTQNSNTFRERDLRCDQAVRRGLERLEGEKALVLHHRI